MSLKGKVIKDDVRKGQTRSSCSVYVNLQHRMFHMEGKSKLTQDVIAQEHSKIHIQVLIEENRKQLGRCLL